MGKFFGPLAAAELDFAFGFGGHAIAGCRTIAPCLHGSQDVPIARRSGALEDQRTVNAAIGADDEAYFHLLPCKRWDQ